MSDEAPYDFVVIGSGPGGEKAAVHAAKCGRRVALVERERELGGACVFQGTIPSKTLREASLAILQLKRSAEVFNLPFREGLEVAALMSRLDRVLTSHTQHIRRVIDGHGIQTFHGRARLIAPDAVNVQSVRGQSVTLRARHIVLATGSRPRSPENIPVDHEHILDSDSILSMIYLPRSLTVVGGGVIASEYASIFSALGVKVTMVDKAPRPLMFLDAELTDKFVSHFQRYGGSYLGERQLVSVRWDGVSQVRAELASGQVVRSDKMLVAQGRTANVEGLGLDQVGVAMSPRGHVQVNAFYQTSHPTIYAVGDVIGPPALAACSMEQGRRAVGHALGQDPGQPFELVPLGIYAVPEMASIGLTEAQAREKYPNVVVGRAGYEEIARGQIAGIEDGLLKLVVDGATRKLLGAQIVGDGATDLVHLAELALINGNEIGVFLENVLNFPTLGEAYRVASLDALDALRASGKSPLAEAA